MKNYAILIGVENGPVSLMEDVFISAAYINGRIRHSHTQNRPALVTYQLRTTLIITHLAQGILRKELLSPFTSLLRF